MPQITQSECHKKVFLHQQGNSQRIISQGMHIMHVAQSVLKTFKMYWQN